MNIMRLLFIIMGEFVIYIQFSYRIWINDLNFDFIKWGPTVGRDGCRLYTVPCGVRVKCL